MKSKLILTSVLLATFLINAIPALAVINDPDEIPLDGGLSLLIGAGIAYGAKKAYDKKKASKQNDEASEK